jgi:Leucine-rich repeat (LRR) protein
MVAVIVPGKSQARPSPSAIKSLAITWDNRALLSSLGDYKNLEVLSITCLVSLKAIPGSIGHLMRLKKLTIDSGSGCSMNPVLPEDFGNLHSLEKLVLYGAQDPSMPDLQPAGRHKFPQSMSQLKNLKYLDLGRNGFKQIPAFVGDLPKLRELRFEFNDLRMVPPFISNLHELKVLRLKGNYLDDLPNYLNSLPNLNLVTLGNNCKITQDAKKMKNLRERFPRVKFDFEDEYDCPTK